MILIISLLIVLILLFIVISKNKYGIESFENQLKKEKINFKLSDSYNLIYRAKKYCVWECAPINEYFPIGQIVTKTQEPPIINDILVDINYINHRTRDYELISSTKDGMKIWKPIVSDDCGVVSYIFSKNKPSLNRIKILPRKCLMKTSIDELHTTSKNFNLWSINNSKYIYCQDSININLSEKPQLYMPNMNCFEPKKKLLLSHTNSFKKLYTNNTISIWRPLPIKNYRTLGDCVFKHDENPNNKKNVPIVHKSFCYPIIDYYDDPVCNIKNLTFWKPRCPNSYGTLGQVISFDKKEPMANEIYSIPLEYLVTNNKLTNVSNSLETEAPEDSDEINNYSVWNNDNFCFGKNDYKKPLSCYKLNQTYCNYEKNIEEIPHEVYMEMVEPNKVELDDELSDRLTNVLSQRCGVSPYRFQDLKFIDNNLYFTIDSKPINTNEDTIREIYETLTLITTKKPISINEDIKLKNIRSNQSLYKENISIDNTEFNKKIN
jgi:hypothetical protein